MKKWTIFLIFIITVIHISPLMADNLPLHLKIMSTHETTEPHIWKDHIFLTVAPSASTRFVGVAFDYELYSVIHPFERNESGVFIFTTKAPDLDKINYRLIIDGLWTSDPLSSNNYKDENGINVSSLYIGKTDSLQVKGPVPGRTGRTLFTIQTIPESTVSIVGTFNGWDPYMTGMTEINPGKYSIDLRLREGTYYYYFIVDGKKKMDPMNFFRAMNTEGEVVCKVTIP